MHKEPEDYHIGKEKEDIMEIIHEYNGQKEDPLSIMEPRRDHDMTPIKGGIED